MAQLANVETILDNIDLENTKVSDLFDKAWKSQYALYKVDDTSSSSYETRRKKTLEVLLHCKSMFEELGLFSENEGLEEVSTSELRYFLNEALMGWLASKTNLVKPEERLKVLREAREYYLSYLKQTRNYEFHKYDLDKFKLNSSLSNETSEFTSSLAGKQAAFDSNMIVQAQERSEKIRRYKEQKEIESQMEKMILVLNSAHTDDDQRRGFFKTFIKYWINKAVDELKLIDDEIQILSRFEGNSNSDDTEHSQARASGSKPEAGKKPFVITKNQLQAAVFGAGYPSLPVYSIDQFYDQLQDRGMMPQDGCCAPSKNGKPVQIGGGVTETQKDKEKAEKDRQEDLHDEESLKKEREWDEFKEDNKRGSGNRYNRS